MNEELEMRLRELEKMRIGNGELEMRLGELERD